MDNVASTQEEPMAQAEACDIVKRKRDTPHADVAKRHKATKPEGQQQPPLPPEYILIPAVVELGRKYTNLSVGKLKRTYRVILPRGNTYC
jgi:hypothetical protein